jgi:hypothetical protein
MVWDKSSLDSHLYSWYLGIVTHMICGNLLNHSTLAFSMDSMALKTSACMHNTQCRDESIGKKKKMETTNTHCIWPWFIIVIYCCKNIWLNSLGGIHNNHGSHNSAEKYKSDNGANMDLWIYQMWDLVYTRSKNPLSTCHTFREHFHWSSKRHYS